MVFYSVIATLAGFCTIFLCVLSVFLIKRFVSRKLGIDIDFASIFLIIVIALLVIGLCFVLVLGVVDFLSNGKIPIIRDLINWLSS